MMRIDDTSVPRVPIAAPIAFATYPLVIFAGTYAPIVAALVTFASFVACARSVPRSVLYGVIVTTVVTVLAAARQPEHFFWGLFGNALEPTTAVGISAIACAFAMGIVLRAWFLRC